jgi:hypothetical protein
VNDGIVIGDTESALSQQGASPRLAQFLARRPRSDTCRSFGLPRDRHLPTLGSTLNQTCRIRARQIDAKDIRQFRVQNAARALRLVLRRGPVSGAGDQLLRIDHA